MYTGTTFALTKFTTRCLSAYSATPFSLGSPSSPPSAWPVVVPSLAIARKSELARDGAAP